MIFGLSCGPRAIHHPHDSVGLGRQGSGQECLDERIPLAAASVRERPGLVAVISTAQGGLRLKLAGGTVKPRE